MKALPLVLAASLVANAALVTVTLRRASAPAGTPAASAPSHSGASRPAAASAGSASVSADIARALGANDAESLRDLLRAAGVPEQNIRQLVQMTVWKKYEARMKALHSNQQPDPNRPWWKDDRSRNNWNGGMTKAQREESRLIQRQAKEEIENLLGVDPNQNNWQQARFAFLPPEKRQALIDIQQDYQELISEVQQDTRGFRLESDAEKLRFLQTEQRRDIESILSPQELRDYELRNSPTAQQLRWKMTQYDATEQEYIAIFPLQKAFDEKYNDNRTYDPFGNPYTERVERDQNYWKERQAAEKQLQDDIRAVIGEERFAESVRRQDQDYQQLEAATRRLELPPDTPQKLFALRDPASAAIQQVVDNPNLTNDQRKTELATLAASTRAQVRSALGEEGAQAYFKNNGMAWLKELEKGNIVTFRTDNPGYDTKSLPKPPKKPTAK
jgi:hypothetical protein